jgi:hypothetical protein
MHKDSNVDYFVSKIEKLLYDEPNVMWAHAYVALSTKTNTFLVIKHLSSNNNFGTYYLEIKYLYLGCSKHIAWNINNQKWKFIKI